MSKYPHETKDLPPVLIQITRAYKGGAGTIGTPYLNSGLSAAEAARVADPERPLVEYPAGAPKQLGLAGDIARLGGILGLIGFVGVLAAMFLGGPSIGSSGLRWLPVALPVIFAAALMLLCAAAAVGFRASAQLRRYDAAPEVHKTVGTFAKILAEGLVSLPAIDRYEQYADVEALILALQTHREVANTLQGDGREKAAAALIEALPILNEYATTIKPSDALRTSAHNAVDAVGIIAAQYTRAKEAAL